MIGETFLLTLRRGMFGGNKKNNKKKTIKLGFLSNITNNNITSEILIH